MVRTRMAPSPTGEYHIGHIRTVLYNYAFAKKNNGVFVLRIEDTDRTRYVEGAVDRILKDIEDYGLSWDEGPRVGGDYGPYVQSERLDLYKKYAQQLVDEGHAYYCFCTSDRLAELRKEQQTKGLKPMYDRHCLDHVDSDEAEKRIANGESYVIRLKVPRDETITFHDIALGDISFDSNDIDDQVLIKSDGFPTYHMAVVVDDHLMGITHIMRGSDWVSSTPKHVLLYQFFGWEMPIHIHLPNLKEVGAGKKLSKRYGSVSAREFLNEGYLPEALLNFLMLLGWNPGGDREIYSLDEFIELFDITKVHKADLVAFDREKLLWFNGTYIRGLEVDELVHRLIAFDPSLDKYDKAKMKAVVTLVQERLKTLGEFKQLSHYFFEDVSVDLKDVVQKGKDEEETKAILAKVHEVLSSISADDWQTETIDTVLHDVKTALEDWSPKQLFMSIRVATTGETATPSLFETLAVIGRESVLKRLEKLIS